MSTLTELITSVSRRLRDESNLTFSVPMVKDLVNDGIVELSRIVPQPFQEDIEADGSASYQLLAESAGRKVWVTRIELWYADPSKFYARIPFSGVSQQNSSESGWRVWNGFLELPYGAAQAAADDTYVIRVWGYKPWTPLVNLSDEADLDADAESAVIECAVYHGYEMLLNERVLFKQYQQQSNNTDVSTAALINAVQTWQSKWDRRRRQLTELHELPD